MTDETNGFDRRAFLHTIAAASGLALAGGTVKAQGAVDIPLATTPHPDNWLAHTPRLEMARRRLGILAHTWFQPEHADQLESIFRTITDIAVEEPTGLALDANVSLQDPLHNMMYEEWEDYDEFFTTQLTRPYRMAFLRWLLPVMSAPISAEFYEVTAQSGDFAGGEATVVLSLQGAGRNEASHALAAEYVAEVTSDPACLGATAMHSLNDPAHLVVVERWATTGDLGTNLADLPSRSRLASGVVEQVADLRISAETYRVHYNPGRFEIPG